MDCLTLRRLVLADPRRADDRMSEHTAQCPPCNNYKQEICQLESVLENAVKLPVPECLPARILLRQSNQSRRIGTWGIAAVLAACWVVAVAIGLRILPPESPARWQAAIQTYMDQTGTTPDLAANVAHRDVDAVLNDLGVALSPDIGNIVAAVPCVIGKRRSAHLTVAGEFGPVTVLIMPDAEISEAVDIKTAGLSGVIAPCPRGSIAILGSAMEPIDEIRQRFEQAITFI
jgi:Protein of unknown function (DUF3379)